MHVPDSANIVGGLYTVGPPRSVIGRHALNAFAYELIGAIQAAGITLRANGTADAAANYTGQLRDAIRRLSWKPVTATHNMTTSAETLTPNYDVFAYQITQGSSLPFAELTIDSDPEYEDLLLVIYNSTTSPKVLLNVDGSPICILAPRESVEIYGVDISGDILWSPVSGTRSGVFDVELRGSISGLIATGVATYRVSNSLVEIDLPNLQDTLTGAQLLTVTGASGGGFPAVTDSAAGEGKRPACIINNNVQSVGMVYFSGAAGSRILNVETGSAGTSFDGISGVNGLQMLFKAV